MREALFSLFIIHYYQFISYQFFKQNLHYFAIGEDDGE